MILNKLLVNSDDVLQKIFDSINKREPLLVTYLNQHCFNIYYEDLHYKKVLDNKFLVYQADFGVYLALKFLFNIKINRIDATEMNWNILDQLIERKIPFVFVGGDFDEKFIIEESKARGINFAGYFNGFFNEDQIESLISRLNNSDNKVFIVGMGVPKQEIFVAKLSKSKEDCVIICVGNFLEFYFGTKKRAPVFIQRIGFEWMFRLFTEPLRLWNRYLVGIPLFIFRILKLKISEIKH